MLVGLNVHWRLAWNTHERLREENKNGETQGMNSHPSVAPCCMRLKLENEPGVWTCVDFCKSALWVGIGPGSACANAEPTENLIPGFGRPGALLNSRISRLQRDGNVNCAGQQAWPGISTLIERLSLADSLRWHGAPRRVTRRWPTYHTYVQKVPNNCARICCGC